MDELHRHRAFPDRRGAALVEPEWASLRRRVDR
jgi:hypothetical protein